MEKTVIVVNSIITTYEVQGNNGATIKRVFKKHISYMKTHIFSLVPN